MTRSTVKQAFTTIKNKTAANSITPNSLGTALENMTDEVPFSSDYDFTLLSGTTWDGSYKYLALTGNTALTLTTTKKSGVLVVKQPSSGGPYTLSIGGTAVVIATGANAYTAICFFYNAAISAYQLTVDTSIVGNVSAGGGGGTQLTAPTLTATNVSSTQNNLAWNDVANETNYELQRSLDQSSWTTINSPAAGSTSYSNTGLTAATQYFYRLRAIGNGTTYTNSNYSNIASATTQGGTVTAQSIADGKAWNSFFSPSLDTTTSGGKVSRIYDQKHKDGVALGGAIENYAMHNSDTGTQPGYIASGINLRPSVVLGDSVKLEAASPSLSAPFEIGFVVQFKADPANKYINEDSNPFDFFVKPNGKLSIYGGAGITGDFTETSYTPVVNTPFVVWGVWKSGKKVDVWVNGNKVLADGDFGNSTTLVTSRMGGNDNFIASSWLTEYFTWSGNMTDAERTAEINKLKTLNGIS